MANPREIDLAIKDYLLKEASPHFTKAGELAQNGSLLEAEQEATTANAILDQAKGVQRFWDYLRDKLQSLDLKTPTLSDLLPPENQVVTETLVAKGAIQISPPFPSLEPAPTPEPSPTPEQIKPTKIVLLDRGQREFEVDGERVRFFKNRGDINWSLLNFFAWINNPERSYSTQEMNAIATNIGSNITINPGSGVIYRLEESLKTQGIDTSFIKREGKMINKGYSVNAHFEGFLPEDNPELSHLRDLDLTPTELKLLQPLLKANPDFLLPRYVWAEMVNQDNAPLNKKIDRLASAKTRLLKKLNAQGFDIVSITPGKTEGGYYLKSIKESDTLNPIIVQSVLGAPPVPGALGQLTTSEELRRRAVEETERVSRVRAERMVFDTSPLYQRRDYSYNLESLDLKKFLQELTSPSRKLLEDFLRDPSSSNRVLNTIFAYPRTGILEKVEFTRHLTAAIFEEVARIHVSTEAEPQYIVLSAEDMVIVLHNIYPERELKEEGYGLNHTIPNVNMTDGMVITIGGRENIITTILEAKFHNRNKANLEESIAAQRRAYHPESFMATLRLTNNQPVTPDYLGVLINAVNPRVPARPLRVDPKLIPMYLVPQESEFDLEGVAILGVPISTEDISDFAEQLKKLPLMS